MIVVDKYNISGIGIDVVEIVPLKRMLDSLGPEAFIERCFTQLERDACRQIRDFAIRFAVKESVMKAFGCGYSGGLAYTQIEVTLNDIGSPRVCLSGRAADLQRELFIVAWLISITDVKEFVLASVIALRDNQIADPLALKA